MVEGVPQAASHNAYEQQRGWWLKQINFIRVATLWTRSFLAPISKRVLTGFSMEIFMNQLGTGFMVIGGLLFGAGAVGNGLPSMPINTATEVSVIKGNVSPTTGERIYRMPGQKSYSSTSINSGFGERLFCSEEEARAAGWRKAKR